VGLLTRHLMEPNKYASWTLLLGLWAPGNGKDTRVATDQVWEVNMLPDSSVCF